MNYPESLKKGDTIGICAPSDGILNPEKILKLDCAINQLKEMGYNVIETESVRKSEKGRSSEAKQRAKEFMELLENDNIKLIIFAAGGDFLYEMLDYLDFEKIKTLKPKWLQGYSDITGIGILFNTLLDIPTIYAQNIKDYAMKPLHKTLIDALEIASGKKICQYSLDMCEEGWNPDEETISPEEPYKLTKKVEWKSLDSSNKIVIEGRAIGGCLDCIQSYIGTKYDLIQSYIEKHKDDGIIWFLESFETGSSNLSRTLWQMKNMGYFEHCRGIVFGRPLMYREEYEIKYEDVLKEELGNLNIPIIFNADIGHVSPQLAIINGGYLKITFENGKGKVENFIK